MFSKYFYPKGLLQNCLIYWNTANTGTSYIPLRLRFDKYCVNTDILWNKVDKKMCQLQWWLIIVKFECNFSSEIKTNYISIIHK